MIRKFDGILGRNGAAVFGAAVLMAAVCASQASADEPPAASGTVNAFTNHVVPFLKTHCLRCHGGDEPEGELSLERFRESANVQHEYEVWQKVLRMLADGEMPPSDEPQPTADEVRVAVRVIEGELAKFDCQQERKQPGRVTLRRLNRVEYNNTIRDLVGINFQPANDFPSDDVGHGFDNIGDVLSIPPILFEKYMAAAEQVIDRAFKDESARQRIVPFGRIDGDTSGDEAARRNLAAFARHAFRRTPSPDEIERLFGLVKFAREQGTVEQEALTAGLVAILTSPHFLFRVELDPAPDDADGIRELNDFELATRLSYFLWSSMPDEELFGLAEKGSLHNQEVLDSQIRRMLVDPKADALVKNFAGQWLQLRDLKSMTPDPERYPSFDEGLRTAMQQETEMFFQAVVREDRSILDFLNADFTFVNERLARHYGMTGVTGNEFRRTASSEQRRGVLTQASVLLLTSNPTRTSPVKRGKWILENMLGDPPPPPPAAVEELNEEGELLGTLRERMEQHRENESCAICHRQMDTLGFGLENFDAIGAWRERDGGSDIDPSGTLPGGVEFRGPAELMKVLADQKANNFSRCLTEKMLTYALGRGLQSSDRCAVDRIIGQLREGSYRFSSLVRAIVKSDPFLYREAKRGD